MYVSPKITHLELGHRQKLNQPMDLRFIKYRFNGTPSLVQLCFGYPQLLYRI